MKILDCTLRDGGYYTDWDFDKSLVNNYIYACNDLPIDYLEVGYRSIPLNGYYGEYYYLPEHVMQRLRLQSNKKLVIILNEKDIEKVHLPELLNPCRGLIDMVRLAIDPKEFTRALILAEQIKQMGFEVGFNVMYMSNWKANGKFLQLLPEINGIADYFYMVDSYGGIYPKEVKETIQLVRSYNSRIPLGFHGHNNMELALINTLTAIEEGCEIVDATITGMGRGAGNLKTELILTALNAKNELEVDFKYLTKVVDGFMQMQKIHEWGTNLPYMVSGAYSLPQKEVMDWVGKRSYSFNAIIRALQNQAIGIVDNENLPKFDPNNHERAVLIGGGNSVVEHSEVIINYLKKNKDILIVHSSAKNGFIFSKLENKQIFCLVGNEGHRLEETFNKTLPNNIICLLPPYPRKMGTYIPESVIGKSFELNNSAIFEPLSDSHTGIALQALVDSNIIDLMVLGYDGYGENASVKEQELFLENSVLFEKVVQQKLFSITSLLKTRYKILSKSIYELV
jgi:4-hydroxy 2-oxovalerate aldolase